MLKVDQLSVAYGDLQVLWDISLSVEPGEVVALVGANAAGKTTTIKAISGLVKALRGKISLDGQELTGRSPDQIVEAGVVQVPEGRRLFGTMTVRENLELGAFSKRARPHRQANLERVLSLLPELEKKMDEPAASLSGGQQQMVAIGRGLMAHPRLLILDEMSLGLAPLLVKRMFDLVMQVAGQGTTTLLVEQNVRQALACAHKAFVLENGRVVMQGKAADLAQDDHLRKAYLGM